MNAPKDNKIHNIFNYPLNKWQPDIQNIRKCYLFDNATRCQFLIFPVFFDAK